MYCLFCIVCFPYAMRVTGLIPGLIISTMCALITNFSARFFLFCFVLFCFCFVVVVVVFVAVCLFGILVVLCFLLL